MSLDTVARPKNSWTRYDLRAYEHLLQRRHIGPRDHLSADEMLALLPELPDWPVRRKLGLGLIRASGRILDWLQTHPGDGWQQRWEVAGADAGMEWLDSLRPAGASDGKWVRHQNTCALACLLLSRMVLPSYDFLTRYRSNTLFDRVRAHMRPDLFARLERHAEQRGLSPAHRSQALVILSKIVLHVGRDVDELTVDDLVEKYVWHRQPAVPARRAPGLALAWELLSLFGVTEPGSTLAATLRGGQRSTRELVSDYKIHSDTVRELLIRYIDERRPSVDYTSVRDMVSILAGTFWADIERHHPGIDSLHLPDEVARAWKERIQAVTDAGGRTRPRRDVLRVLTRVRSLYWDIQQWALDDPSWVQFAVPSPISRRETLGSQKAQRAREARMHQRVRERMPRLPDLVDTAERRREHSAALLAAATAADPGSTFTHDGRTYNRTRWNPEGRAIRAPAVSPVEVTELGTGEVINLTKREDDCFWAWAIIETLRHTGVRVEELMEISHLALVSYQLSDSGEVVPLLQIVPSKTNEERLLLVSPELASVLATIITRLRMRSPDGAVPLVARYDDYERVTGPRLPHLFQRQRAARNYVIYRAMIRRLINEVIVEAGLLDAAGQPLVFTPHDFRRMFATAAVSGGLPVHIAARLLGHANLETTQAYLAVFQDDLIRAYQAFLAHRRCERPADEYREPTEEEWIEFQQHFHARTLELGACARPYGTPCRHEHACIRCPMLRVDPRQRRRLAEIIANLGDRIIEARENGWLGEEQGLQVSLDAARQKLAALDKTNTQGPIAIGMPTITSHRSGSVTKFDRARAPQ